MKQSKLLGVFALAFALVLTGCGEAKSESKHKHDWGQYVQTKAPTCTEDGVKERECKTCHEKQTQKIDALGHDWVNDAGAIEPDCLNDGSANQHCSRCSETKQGVVLPKTGHDFSGELITDDPAQIGVAGSGHRVCQNANCPGEDGHKPAWQVEEIPALVPSVNITGAALVKDASGDVSIKLSGTEQYYDEVPAQFKWAFGLLENSAPRNQWGQQQGQARYVIGKAAADLKEEDYNVVAEIKEDKSFEVSFKLTDIVPNTGVPYKGLFRVYAGPYLADNSNYTTLRVSVDAAEGTNTADKNYYNFYWRNDQEVGNVLTVGVMPSTSPFELTSCVATYVAAAGEEKEHTYVEIGGKWKGSETTVEAVQAALDAVYAVEEKEGSAPVEGVKWTQEEIDAAVEGDPAFGKTTDDWKTEPKDGVDPVVRPVFIQFQSESNAYYGPTGHSGNSANDPEEYPITYQLYAKQVGSEIHAFVKIDVSFMGSVDATVFNTHMNLLDKSQENCVMGEFTNEAVALPGGTMELVIFSNPNGANNAANAYGNLAFKVQAKTAA